MKTNKLEPAASAAQREKVQKEQKLHKEQRLSIRVTPPQKFLLTQAAQARRTSISQFVLQSSLDAAASLLAEQTRFCLQSDQWVAFCQRLDEPPQAIPALQRFFGEAIVW